MVSGHTCAAPCPESPRNGGGRIGANPRFPVSESPHDGKIGEAVRQILKDHTFFREQKSTFRSTPKVYDYVFKRLPLATDMLRILEFGNYEIGHGPDGSYTIDSGTGVQGKFWVLHNADGQKIFTAKADTRVDSFATWAGARRLPWPTSLFREKTISS